MSKKQLSLHVNDRTVKVFTSEYPGPVVMTEEVACRQLLAFPDLLAACKELVETFRDMIASGEPVLCRARAIIARAEGGDE